jgi:hypothetical protein
MKRTQEIAYRQKEPAEGKNKNFSKKPNPSLCRFFDNPILLKTILFIVLPLLFTAHAGCKKEEDIIKKDDKKPSVYESSMDIKWVRFFSSDTACAYFLDPCFFEDYVVFCTRGIVFNKGELGIGVFHKATGERHPSWDRDPGGVFDANANNLSDWQLGGSNNQIALAGNQLKLYALNLTTGQNEWFYEFRPLYGLTTFTSLFRSFIITYGPSALSPSWKKMARIDAETGHIKDLLTLTIEDNYEFAIMPPASWISPENDTVLLFLRSGWNFPLSKGKVDAYAYNLSADTVMWRAEDIDVSGNASFYTPIVVGNKVVFQCLRSIHCYEITSGKLLWEHLFTDASFGNIPFKYAEGKVFARATSRLMAYDLNTGLLLWENPDDYGVELAGCMDYYKGRLYFTGIDRKDRYNNTMLFCLDGSTGELIWKDGGVNRTGMMADGVIIDQSTGYLMC